MSEPICTVMVGLPGLGKSTLIKGMWKDTDTFIYSTDGYIEQQAQALNKTYDDVFKDYIDKATFRMNALLDIAIKDGVDIIWDQTNLGAGKRHKIIDQMSKAGYQVRCVCIVPPEAGHISDQKDWKHRLANRPGKTIPDEVVSNMYRSFTMPTVEEGFDMITFYNMHGALLGIDYGVEQ
jgi:tRNA uridine 5-carbamoylmethylation protein Kti12